MGAWPSQQVFVVYAIASVVLCLNLLGLWLYSGVVRSKSGTSPNPEDARAFGAALAEETPPEVARVLRAHTNAQAAIVPFLLIGGVYLTAGASGVVPVALFGVFTATRLAHSFAYLKELQPWRTVSFVIGMACTVVMSLHLLWLLTRLD